MSSSWEREDHGEDFICIACKREPEEIHEVTMFAADMGITADEYVRDHESTLNRTNGHFLCPRCFARVSTRCPPGWTAP